MTTQNQKPATQSATQSATTTTTNDKSEKLATFVKTEKIDARTLLDALQAHSAFGNDRAKLLATIIANTDAETRARALYSRKASDDGKSVVVSVDGFTLTIERQSDSKWKCTRGATFDARDASGNLLTSKSYGQSDDSYESYDTCERNALASLRNGIRWTLDTRASVKAEKQTRNTSRVSADVAKLEQALQAQTSELQAKLDALMQALSIKAADVSESK